MAKSKTTVILSGMLVGFVVTTAAIGDDNVDGV